ncbi:unnamed protein product [Amoebophrya sp. A25]|nr:unnamed protein product [Amoebophrya sp. A25]|eukprot:GSA25T00012392001.1
MLNYRGRDGRATRGVPLNERKSTNASQTGCKLSLTGGFGFAEDHDLAQKEWEGHDDFYNASNDSPQHDIYFEGSHRQVLLGHQLDQQEEGDGEHYDEASATDKASGVPFATAADIDFLMGEMPEGKPDPPENLGRSMGGSAYLRFRQRGRMNEGAPRYRFTTCKASRLADELCARERYMRYLELQNLALREKTNYLAMHQPMTEFRPRSALHWNTAERGDHTLRTWVAKPSDAVCATERDRLRVLYRRHPKGSVPKRTKDMPDFEKIHRVELRRRNRSASVTRREKVGKRDFRCDKNGRIIPTGKQELQRAGGEEQVLQRLRHESSRFEKGDLTSPSGRGFFSRRHNFHENAPTTTTSNPIDVVGDGNVVSSPFARAADVEEQDEEEHGKDIEDPELSSHF